MDFNVIVEDRTPPVFAGCPADITASADENCQASVSWIAPTVSDNCGTVTVTSSHRSGDTFLPGTTEVTYNAVDTHGNVSTCVFHVIVSPPAAPVISNCPADVLVSAGESGEAQATWTEPTASTQCGTAILTSSHSPGIIFPIGTTVVTYTATDAVGNTSQCMFNVVVSYEDLSIDISKVITPDGDGQNDTWTIGNIEKFLDNRVVIVDRWGGLIYQSSGYNNESVSWKGTNTTGGTVPTGTYFFSVEVNFRGKRLERRGFIELIR
jgi:gliding motility-associated-like protein